MNTNTQEGTPRHNAQPSMASFLTCTAGIFVCYMLFGLFQEYLYVQSYNMSENNGIKVHSTVGTC